MEIGLPVQEKKIFKGFLPYMGMAAILVMGPASCHQIFISLYLGVRTGLVVRASDSGSGDPGSILGRVGVLFIPPAYEVFRGYIVFAFSVTMFVCLSVNFFFCQGFLGNYLT